MLKTSFLLFSYLIILLQMNSLLVYAYHTPDSQPTKVQEQLDALKKDHLKNIEKWRKSGQQHLPSLRSPLISSDQLSEQLPPECVSHIEEETRKLNQGGYSKEAWIQHIFMCELCCAPLLNNSMDMHVSHVVEHPHLVVLFDFDTYNIKKKYQEKLNSFMKDFNLATDQVLMIGRASQIGHRAYNIVLSGQRAVEIKDYIMAKFGLGDHQIHYLFFGYDPPQLTLDIAKRYGVTREALQAIDIRLRNRAPNKINQSVVMVIDKGGAAAVAAHKPPQPAEPRSHEKPPVPEAPQSASASTRAASLSTSRDSRPPLTGTFTMITGSSTSRSFDLGQEIAKAARDLGLGMVLEESGGGFDTVDQLLKFGHEGVGMMPSDMPAILNRSSNPDLKRLAKQLRLIAPFYSEKIHLFAHTSIKRLEDLEGKRVIIGTPRSGTWLTATYLLNQVNTRPVKLIEDLDPVNAIAAVIRGQADAMFYVGDQSKSPFRGINNLKENSQYAMLLQNVHFIPLIPKPELRGYDASTIGPDDYEWLEKTSQTLSVKMVLASVESATYPDSHQEPVCSQLAALAKVIQQNTSKSQRSEDSTRHEIALSDVPGSWTYHECAQTVYRAP